MTIATETKAKLPPSKHEFAEVIHRLEAGGQCYPTLRKSHADHWHIQSLCCADGFLLATYSILPSVSFYPFPFFKYFIQKEYLDLHNHYAGDDADLRIWRGEAPIRTSGIYGEGETFKMPKLLHHWFA